MLRTILPESESKGRSTADLGIVRVQAEETICFWRLPLKFTTWEIRSIVPGKQPGLLLFLHGRGQRDLPEYVDANEVVVVLHSTDLASDLISASLRLVDLGGRLNAHGLEIGFRPESDLAAAVWNAHVLLRAPLAARGIDDLP